MEILIFTDGGGFKKPDNTFDAVSAFSLFLYDKEKNSRTEIGEFQVFAENHTSAYGEINAIALALEKAHQYVEAAGMKDFMVRVYTDSMLYLNSLTVWIYNWIRTAKKGVFYGSKGDPVVNQDEIKKAFAYMTKLKEKGNIKLYHINSHTAKYKVKELYVKFQMVNRCQLTEEEFLFIYLQNQRCDEAVKRKYESVVKK